ncbi:MAG: fimbrial protein [Gibbsiella quercinecans]|uniref:MrkD-like receptor binding domain-containing protein n=1 Tax=Gibbsiella quercinecans TaxID=929813 RepID=A0A250B3M8_9GAMM|nr:fimbrial protein [Gibbsiella quercinecans]ATA20562.1 hypothetical protein AWC35_15095 [Gibbsiella quercinecans]RLM05490.1 hypothetical protein BIY30_18245 [Gibbsiella quercinecans]RLM10724.1 hypothetical protein BIY31_06445 [Gibbsiella quercinecans]TCT89291.1 type 1 fimbria pilin [Gibbsiella quercinecans]
MRHFKALGLLRCLLPLSLLLGYAGDSLAANCTTGTATPLNQSVNFGSVLVQRDAAVGSVIATANTTNTSQQVAVCTVSTYVRKFVLAYGSGTALGNNIYPTNLAGVGIRVNRAGTYYANPAQPINYSASSTLSIVDAATVTLELIKTGPITSGALATGTAAKMQFMTSSGSYFDGLVTNITGGSVKAVACSVNNTNITVNMGDVKKQLFTGVGSTPAEGSKNFSVDLNCDASTKVNIQIDGTKDTSNAQGVLALSSAAGSSSAATGVGIQLLYNSSPITLGTAFSAGTVSTAGAFSIPMVARYYQTLATITPGVANGNATFTMTYR